MTKKFFLFLKIQRFFVVVICRRYRIKKDAPKGQGVENLKSISSEGVLIAKVCEWYFYRSHFFANNYNVSVLNF